MSVQFNGRKWLAGSVALAVAGTALMAATSASAQTKDSTDPACIELARELLRNREKMRQLPVAGAEDKLSDIDKISDHLADEKRLVLTLQFAGCDLESAIKAAKGEPASRVAMSDQPVDALGRPIVPPRKSCADLESDVVTLQASMRSLHAQLEALRNRQSETRKQLDEIETRLDRGEKVMGAYEKVRNTYGHLNRNFTDESKQIRSKLEDISRIRNEINEILRAKKAANCGKAQPVPAAGPAVPQPPAAVPATAPATPKAPAPPQRPGGPMQYPGDKQAEGQPADDADSDCVTLTRGFEAANADITRYSREIRQRSREIDQLPDRNDVKEMRERLAREYEQCLARVSKETLGDPFAGLRECEPLRAIANAIYKQRRAEIAQRGMEAVEGHREAWRNRNRLQEALKEKKCVTEPGVRDARSGRGPQVAAVPMPPGMGADDLPPIVDLLPPGIIDLLPPVIDRPTGPQRGPVPPQQSGPTLPPPKLPAPAGAKPPQAASAPACPAGNFDAQCTAPQSPNASSTGWSTTELMNCVTLQRIQEREKQGWTCTRKAAQACNDLAAIQKAGDAPASGGTMTCDKDAKGCQTNCRWVTKPTTLKASITPALLAPPVLPAPHAAPAPALLPPSLLPPVAVGPPRHTVPQPPQHASAPHVVPQPPHVVPRPPAQKKKRHVQRRQRHAPVSDYDEAANTAAVIGAIGAIIGAMGSGPSYGGGHGGGYRGHTAPAPAMRRH